MAEQVAPAEQTIEQWRAAMFEELGFNSVEAASLAVAHTEDRWPVSLHYVTSLIEKGCPLDLVLRIVL